MPIKQFTIGASHTINLGNYENVHIEAKIVIDMDDDDDFQGFSEQAQKDLRALLEQTYREQRQKIRTPK
jgi:hypothetical protein